MNLLRKVYDLELQRPARVRQKLRISSKHIKGSKERLFIVTQTHSLQMFGVIPFVKLQNDA